MNSSSFTKLIVFLLLTAAFISGVVAYSNSRGHTSSSWENGEVMNDNDDGNRRYEKQFTVSEDGELDIEADAGTVKIDSWDKNEVSVVVEIEGNDNRVEKYHVEFKQEGNKVTVIGKVRDRNFFKWHVGNLEAYYTVFVPKKFNTVVSTSGGDIEARNLIGSIDYTTSGGNINVEKVEGQTIVSTSGGDVNIRDVHGRVEAETSGGNVMCENVVGSVNGNTSGGNVEMRSIDGKVKAGTSGGNIIIKVTGENKGIFAETSGGSIDIYIKEEIAADIDAETSGGSVDCDLPVTVRGKVRDSELHGKINGGGNLIHAETSGGSIHIIAMK